jgi:C-terminal processing protease CtpA/Prc
MLKTVIPSPWGPRQPDPYFDHSMKVYELALTPGLRSPFALVDELHPDQPAKAAESKPTDEKTKKDADAKKAGEEKKSAEEKKPAPVVTIDFTDIASRLNEVPVPPGNYSALQNTDKRLCWLDRTDDPAPKRNLQCVDIANKGEAPETVWSDVKGYEISLDHKKVLASKGDDFYIFDSDAKASTLSDAKTLGKAKIDMSRWAILTNPRAEFHEMFLDAWRLERDYFYDRNMHGVDWPSIRDRYLPLVDRVADRDELNNVIAQMVSELSALHIFVFGGDSRKPADQIDLASLGAVLRRDEQAGGYVVEHIYLHDPDLPNLAPPFARPDSLVHEGEVIVSLDGEDALSVPDERALLRGKAGRKVDVRHNGGGNIDSWILGKLLRKAWFYWQPRIGNPTWNMHYAFRGHVVVLCDEFTGSDGEAFTEGIRRLDIGKVIGTRTWGGEIWLSASNVLADEGIATAAETGVYGPEGKWLIEGYGVDPDIIVDNLPHATFAGGDAQLDAAMKLLADEIRKDPRPVPKAPAYPLKAFKYEK